MMEPPSTGPRAQSLRTIFRRRSATGRSRFRNEGCHDHDQTLRIITNINRNLACRPGFRISEIRQQFLNGLEFRPFTS
jgi:hypothetical protein